MEDNTNLMCFTSDISILAPTCSGLSKFDNFYIEITDYDFLDRLFQISDINKCNKKIIYNTIFENPITDLYNSSSDGSSDEESDESSDESDEDTVESEEEDTVESEEEVTTESEEEEIEQLLDESEETQSYNTIDTSKSISYGFNENYARIQIDKVCTSSLFIHLSYCNLKTDLSDQRKASLRELMSNKEHIHVRISFSNNLGIVPSNKTYRKIDAWICGSIKPAFSHSKSSTLSVCVSYSKKYTHHVAYYYFEKYLLNISGGLSILPERYVNCFKIILKLKAIEMDDGKSFNQMCTHLSYTEFHVERKDSFFMF